MTCWLRLYILRGSLWERIAVCSGTACINVFSPIKRSSNKSSSPRGALARSFTRDDRRSTTTDGGIVSERCVFCFCIFCPFSFGGRGGGGGGGGESREEVAEPLAFVLLERDVDKEEELFGLRPDGRLTKPFPTRSLSKHLHTSLISARRETLTVSIRSMSSCNGVCVYG